MTEDRRRTVRTVDVRDLQSPPVDVIVEALGDLEPGERIVVRTSTVPIRLCDALEKRGWDYLAVRTGGDGWRIRITAGAGGDEVAEDRRHRSEPPTS